MNSLLAFLLDGAETLSGRDEASEVLRTLIVSFGGFCAGMAFVVGLWRLSPWIHRGLRPHRQPFNFFFGLMLISYAGISVLTTDHIYQHLIADDTPLWQLYVALVSFVVGSVALIGIVAKRTDLQ